MLFEHTVRLDRMRGPVHGSGLAGEAADAAVGGGVSPRVMRR